MTAKVIINFQIKLPSGCKYAALKTEFPVIAETTRSEFASTRKLAEQFLSLYEYDNFMNGLSNSDS